MSKQLQSISQGKNFKAVNAGPWGEIGQYVLGEMKGKVFLKDALGATGTELSFGVLPAGVEVPFFHKHKQNEEIYIVLSGKGEMQVDEQAFDVCEGSVVRVAPGGASCLKSAADTPLTYACLQMKAGSLTQWAMADAEIAEQKAAWK